MEDDKPVYSDRKRADRSRVRRRSMSPVTRLRRQKLQAKIDKAMTAKKKVKSKKLSKGQKKEAKLKRVPRRSKVRIKRLPLKKEVTNWDSKAVARWWKSTFPARLWFFTETIRDFDVTGVELGWLDERSLLEFEISHKDCDLVLNEIKKLAWYVPEDIDVEIPEIPKRKVERPVVDIPKPIVSKPSSSLPSYEAALLL